MTDRVVEFRSVSRMSYPPEPADPAWSYDMNIVRAELNRACTDPQDEAERVAVRLLASLYVPAPNDIEADRAVIQNFFAIRKTLREYFPDKAGSE